jgi:hypothetical protein
LIRIAEVASVLSDEGGEFNRHLVEQFKGWERVDIEGMGDTTAIPDEHILFYKAVAQTLGWLQQIPIPQEGDRNNLMDRLSPVPIIYLRVLLEARSGLVKDAGQRLEELLEQGQREAKMRRPRRLLAVIAGLETWTRVELPDVGTTGALDIEEVQRLALNAGGRAHWTALAPLKMYALYKGPDLLTPRAIFLPGGSAVSRGIERLFGFVLGESESDYRLSRGLHRKLADLAHTSVWDINSGFYRLGGGS